MPESTGFDTRRALKKVLAGAISGMITKSAVAPMERVKILYQIQGMKAAAGQGPKYTGGLLGSLKTILQEDGFRALYKGNGANVVRVVPVYALKFGFNDIFKDMVREEGQKNLRATQLMLSGSAAGLFQSSITYPLETIRTRLAVCEGLGGVKYNGIIDCGRKTIQHEGVKALYKGIVPTWLSGAPYVGLQMSAYDLLQQQLPLNPETGKPVIVWSLLCGATAGVVAQTITFPGDTIRRRMQTDGMGGRPKVYNSMVDCIQKVLAQEGIKGFYKGVVINAYRAVPGAAIQFFVYDFFKALLDV